MDLRDLQNNWNKFGKRDPLWAILAEPDKKGNRWRSEEFFATGVQEITKLMEYIEKLGIQVARCRALDFGCGVGRLTQALSEYFDQVVGVDIAHSMVEQARKYNRYGQKCQYYVNEVDDLQIFPGGHFDFIYTNIVLQHIAPPYAKSYLKEFLRVLAPQGVLIFQLPSERKEVIKSKAAPKQEDRGRPILQEVKRFIKPFMPTPLLQLYRRVADWQTEPVMEMHCVKREEVEAFLLAAGAHMIDVIPYDVAGDQYISFRYTVGKSREPMNEEGRANVHTERAR